jgi:hypothetical protein
MEPTHASADGAEHQVGATIPDKCKIQTNLANYEPKNPTKEMHSLPTIKFKEF